MKKFRQALSGLTAALLLLSAAPFWGQTEKAGRGRHILSSPAESGAELIADGLHGPFVEDGSSWALFDDYTDCLVEGETTSWKHDPFRVVCSTTAKRLGTALALVDDPPTVTGLLMAVSGPAGHLMPELKLAFPLAGMEQKFFAQNIIQRTLKSNSIFDEPCRLTYQVDGRPPVSEDWLCSSFLGHFDPNTGQAKIYYELRVRPVAMMSTTGTEKRDWRGFFQKLQGHKELKVKVDLAGETMAADLNLSDFDWWLGRVLNMYQTGRAKPPAAEADQDGLKVFGPFDGASCRVNRFISPPAYISSLAGPTINMFLVDCRDVLEVKDRSFGTDAPWWFNEIYDDMLWSDSDAESELKNNRFRLSFPFRGGVADGNLFISYSAEIAIMGPSWSYNLREMDPAVFESRLVRETLADGGLRQAPCQVSYMVDGRPPVGDPMECRTSYSFTGDDVIVHIRAGYPKTGGLYTKGGPVAVKDYLSRAISFMEGLDKKPDKVVVEIKLEGYEPLSAELDMSEFDPEAIKRARTIIETIK